MFAKACRETRYSGEWPSGIANGALHYVVCLQGDIWPFVAKKKWN